MLIIFIVATIVFVLALRWFSRPNRMASMEERRRVLSLVPLGAAATVLHACHVPPPGPDNSVFITIAGRVLVALDNALASIAPSVQAMLPVGIVDDARRLIVAAQDALSAYSRGASGNTCGAFEAAVQAAVQAGVAVLGALQAAGVATLPAGLLIGIESAAGVVDSLIAVSCPPSSQRAGARPQGSRALRGLFAAGASPLRTPIEWVDVPADLQAPPLH